MPRIKPTHVSLPARLTVDSFTLGGQEAQGGVNFVVPCCYTFVTTVPQLKLQQLSSVQGGRKKSRQFQNVGTLDHRSFCCQVKPLAPCLAMELDT
eukprot:4600282-Amphidinium_carterae.1